MTTNATTPIDTTNTFGVSTETIDSIHYFLAVERVSVSGSFLNKWLQIGDICSRIKAAKLEGKFSERVNEFFGTDLTNDERQYSMKLHELEAGVQKWYKEVGCLKYNPRTIYTAYQAYANPAVEKTDSEKKEEKTEKVDKELRKERSGADTIKAMTEYKRIRDNASENGNLLLGDLETLLSELKNEMTLIEGMIEFEKPATTTKNTKGAKVKKAA